MKINKRKKSKGEKQMKENERHMEYDYEDIKRCLFKLKYITIGYREYMIRRIQYIENEAVAEVMVNILNNTEGNNFDYLTGLDDAVVKEFMYVMKEYGYV